MIRQVHLLMEYSNNKNAFASMVVKNRVSLVVVTVHASRHLRALMAYPQRTREKLKRFF